MARLSSVVKAGYYPTPPNVVEIIVRFFLDIIPGPLAACDPCCGEGDALAQLLALLNPGTKSYGVELDENRAQKAQEKLGVVVQGDALKIYCQPGNPFSLVFLNPPYGEMGGKRLEYEFLKVTVRKLLAEDGVLVFVIPYYVIPKIADYWSAWFAQTICLKFPKEDFHTFKQVVLFGKRLWRKKPVPDPETKRFLGRVVHAIEAGLNPDDDRFFDADGLPERVPTLWVPFSDPPQVFMTTDLSEEDFLKIAEETGLRREVFNSIALPDSTVPFSPLMSLRQGHLVQILVSGALNGKLRDDKGNEIWVKGSVWKEFQEIQENFESEEGDRRTEVTVRREKFMYAVTYWTPEGHLKRVTL